MRVLTIIIFFFFITINAFSQTLETNELKILSWNVYMLPGFPLMTGQVKRAHGIVEVLQQSDYDIICFQEAFHKRFRRIVLKGLKEQYPYQVIWDKKFSLRAPCGLWIFSKKPIHKVKEIVFNATASMEGTAKKGAILFTMDGLEDFHFIVTHMQSADGVKQTAVRKSQSLQILTELVEPFKDLNKALLFAGDWNMEAGANFDNLSLRKMFNITYPKSMPTENTWPSPSFAKNEKSYLLDLIMLYDSKQNIFDFNTSIPNLEYEWKTGKIDLSDHMPIDATFSVKKN